MLEHWVYAKVSLDRASAEASFVATLGESLPLSSSVNGQKLIISAHIRMKKARSDNYQYCNENIIAVTISVLSRSDFVKILKTHHIKVIAFGM